VHHTDCFWCCCMNSETDICLSTYCSSEGTWLDMEEVCAQECGAVPTVNYEMVGNVCYYDCSATCDSSGWHLYGCTYGGNITSYNTYYISNDRCYYNCDVSCGSSG
jgi:hypothetical protein